MVSAAIFLEKFADSLATIGYMNSGRNEFSKSDSESCFPRIEYSRSGPQKSEISIIVGYVIPEINNSIRYYLDNNNFKELFKKNFNFTIFNAVENYKTKHIWKYGLYPNIIDMTPKYSDCYIKEVINILEVRFSVSNRYNKIVEWINSRRDFPYGTHIYTIPAILIFLNQDDILESYLKFAKSEYWPENHDIFIDYLRNEKFVSVDQSLWLR
jgi:hypothetical protein